ncbi:MAG TPA: MFS transporter [Thermomicrobiaceae bacterium]|nr:MFS transporter [Thermomicrobiaceae bacterium]
MQNFPRSLLASPLLHHADFLKLWIGQSISLVGTEITLLALPLTAIQVLHASPLQVATLAAVERIPNLALSLPTGVLADRVRRRPLLIAANLGRAIVLAGIPLAAFLGVLTLPLLYVVSFVTTSLGLVFDNAYAGFLPSLIRPEQLLDGNSKLEVSRTAASTVGPGLAGFLIQTLTAPLAILFDSVSYLVSIAALALIEAPERPPETRPGSAWHDLREGVAFVLGRPIIRSMILAVGAANLFLGGLVAEYILFMTNTLHLSPASIGWLIAAGGASGIAGALLGGTVGRVIGAGRAMMLGGMVYGLGALVLALAQGALPQIVLFVVAGEVLMGISASIYTVNFVSLVQTDVPAPLLGRTNSLSTLVISGTVPIGALLGGAVAQTAGLRPTLVAVGCGVILAFGALIFSPVYRFHGHESS